MIAYILILSLSLVLGCLVGWLNNFLNDLYFKRFYHQYPICPEWDCRVSNWLIEDDLKIEFRNFNVYGYAENVCSILTPIGEIWVGNFPYAFCRSDDTVSVMPSYETRTRLKEKLISMGLHWDSERHCFNLPPEMIKTEKYSIDK
jgi:hypothetical protein